MTLLVYLFPGFSLSLIPSCTPSKLGRASGNSGQHFGQDDFVIKNKIIQQKYLIPYLYFLTLPPNHHTLVTTTKPQRLTTDSGRDTRHLVWFKSHRQYTIDFPLTLLIAFHMTQYQRTLKLLLRRSCSQINLRNT